MDWSRAQVEEAILTWGHIGLTPRTESPLDLLGMQRWAQGTWEGAREERKPWSSSHRWSALLCNCWRRKGRGKKKEKEDQEHLWGHHVSEPKTSKSRKGALVKCPSPKPKPSTSAAAYSSDAGHTQMGCPKLLHTHCKCSQAIVQETRSDLSNREHIQKAPGVWVWQRQETISG